MNYSKHILSKCNRIIGNKGHLCKLAIAVLVFILALLFVVNKTTSVRTTTEIGSTEIGSTEISSTEISSTVLDLTTYNKEMDTAADSKLEETTTKQETEFSTTLEFETTIENEITTETTVIEQTTETTIEIQITTKNEITTENEILTEDGTEVPETTQEETTRRLSGEVVDLSISQYAEYKHQTTGTMWNDDSSARCTHPDLLVYCEEVCDRWFAKELSMEEARSNLLACPIKTNQDYHDLTGGWMWDENPNNTFEVVATNLANAYFDGYIDHLDKGESYQQIGFILMNEEVMAVRHFLYMKAYYDSELDKTIIYYAAVQWKWFRATNE